MKVFALTNGDVSCASTLYRLLQFRPMMERDGVAFDYAPAAEFTDLARLREADVVVIQKYLLPPDRVDAIRNTADGSSTTSTTPSGIRRAPSRTAG
jgi:hypothetical protein